MKTININFKGYCYINTDDKMTKEEIEKKLEKILNENFDFGMTLDVEIHEEEMTNERPWLSE